MKTSYCACAFDTLWFFIKQSLWAADLRSLSPKIHSFFYWYVFDKIFSEPVSGGMKSHFGQKIRYAPIVLNVTVIKKRKGHEISILYLCFSIICIICAGSPRWVCKCIAGPKCQNYCRNSLLFTWDNVRCLAVPFAFLTYLLAFVCASCSFSIASVDPHGVSFKIWCIPPSLSLGRRLMSFTSFSSALSVAWCSPWNC